MNNDLISREDLKKNCAEVVMTSNNSDFIPCPTWNKAMELIDNAPTVPLPDFKEGYKQAIRDGKTNFSRQRGKWIKKVDDVGFVSYICDKCGFELELEDCSDSYYCTNCGADMRSGQNNKCNVSYLHQDSITKTDTKI